MREKVKLNWHAFPIALLVVVAYLIMGFVANLWHPGWMIFLVIPLYHYLVDVFTKKRFRGLIGFLSTVISTLVFVIVGLVYNVWHPTWLVFFLIPIAAGIENFLYGGVKQRIKKGVDRVQDSVANVFADNDDDHTVE